MKNRGKIPKSFPRGNVPKERICAGLLAPLTPLGGGPATRGPFPCSSKPLESHVLQHVTVPTTFYSLLVHFTPFLLPLRPRRHLSFQPPQTINFLGNGAIFPCSHIIQCCSIPERSFPAQPGPRAWLQKEEIQGALSHFLRGRTLSFVG